MAGYTRQSSGDIVTGNTVEASHFNNEYNQLEAAFDASTGHAHDGSSGNAPKINLTTSVAGVLPIANGGTGSATGDPTFNSVTADTINFSGNLYSNPGGQSSGTWNNATISLNGVSTSKPTIDFDQTDATASFRLQQQGETFVLDNVGVTNVLKVDTGASEFTTRYDTTINNASPKFEFWDSNGDVDNKRFAVSYNASDNRLKFQALTDAGVGGGNVIYMNTSGNSLDTMEFLRAGVTWATIDNSSKEIVVEDGDIRLLNDQSIICEEVDGTNRIGMKMATDNELQIGSSGTADVQFANTGAVKPGAAGLNLGTTSFPFANAHFDDTVYISKGTAPTTDAGTVLAASQVGEAVSNLKLMYAMDSGTTFDTTIVDGTGTPKGLFKHDQLGGPSANGSWNLFPKDNVISYSWNDVRFSPSAVAFNPDLGSNSLDFKDIYYSGSLNNTSDRNLKEVIVEDASVDIDVEVITGVTLRSILRVVKNTPHSIFTINKDPKKQISFGVIAQNLVAYAALEGITEEQLEEFRFISWHPETEDGPGSYTVDYKEISNVRDLIRDLESEGVVL